MAVREVDSVCAYISHVPRHVRAPAVGVLSSMRRHCWYCRGRGPRHVPRALIGVPLCSMTVPIKLLVLLLKLLQMHI